MNSSHTSKNPGASRFWRGPRFRSLLDRPVTAWVIFGLSLIVTWFAWDLSNQHIRQRAEDRFTLRSAQLQQQIASRLLEYEQVLRGGVGLCASSETVSRDEWSTYVKNCQLDHYFPGFQCMGYAVCVSKDRIKEHELEIQAEGFDHYHVHPVQDRDTYTSIVYIEPFDWRNKRAFGYDMYSEPIRRRAMDRAIDTGLPAVSGKIKLVQETADQPQHGFLYYLPFYRNGTDPKTVEQRRESIAGFVYAAFRANDLMQQIAKEQEQGIRFVVHDAPQVSPDAILFDSQSNTPRHLTGSLHQLSVDLPLHLRGRDWTLHFETNDNFFQASDRLQSQIVAIGGIAVDVLFFFVIASIGRQKQRALGLAQKMTEEMRDSEELTSSILENVTEAIITVHVDGEIRMFNEAAETMFGQPSEQAAGTNFEGLLHQLNWEQALQRIKESQFGSTIVKCQRTSGDIFPCRIALGRVSTEKQFCYIITARDETARIESEARIAEVHQQLIDASHKSGMAEVVTGVLHNVGNILNSLQVSSGVMTDKVRSSHVPKLRQAADILLQHQDDLAGFLTNNPQGKQFVGYLDQLSTRLLEDHDLIEGELQNVQKNIDHIGCVIRSQQQNARVALLDRDEDAAALMDDACQIVSARNVNLNIQVVRSYHQCPTLRSDRHKILQILVNLIKNAQDAVGELEERPRVIRLSVSALDSESVYLVVKDNGIGMTPAQLEKVLSFGFTTKPDGHGFGLHSCLNAARQLGGEIAVESHGPGLGSKFTLTLPVVRSDEEMDTNEVSDPALV